MENQETSPTAGASSGTIPEATVARKPCPSCGEMIAETAKKCRFCGEVLNASIAPAADAGAGAAMPPGGIANAPGAAKLLLYNPNVASSLSVFFTAIFGSWCCRHNYQALGLPEKARRSQIWMIVSIIHTALSLFVPGLGKTWLIFLIAWYYCDGRKQAQYLKENNIVYEKKGWLKPVLVALVPTVVILALALAPLIAGGNLKDALAKESVSIVDQIVAQNFGANAPKCTHVKINGQKNDSTYNGTAFFANGKSLEIIIKYNAKTDWVEVEIPNQ